MGEARRRKLAGEPPKQEKRERPVRTKKLNMFDQMLDASAMATAMVMMMGARRSGFLPKAYDSTAHAQADTDPLPFEPSRDELED